MLAALALVAAPLLAVAVDGEPGPSGLALSGSVDGGVVGGDVVGGFSVGAGIETQPFALHLKAPLLFRLVDVDPEVSAALPSYCRFLRCEELLTRGGGGQTIDPTAIARVVDELRIFSPGDTLWLRAGQLTATVGDGAVVDRVTTAASWDRRTSGAYFAAHLPWQRLDVDAFVADVVSPGELVAGRVAVAPFDGPVVVALDAGADFFAPVDVVDRFGEVRAGGETRTLSSSTLSASLSVFDGAFDLAPRIEGGVVTGLSDDGGDTWWVGAGGGVGVDAGLDVGLVDARLKLTGWWGTPGYRRGLFSTLHLVERRAALAGASVDGANVSGGLARVAAPGGPGVDVRLEASAFDAVAPILRLHLEEAPGGNSAEAGVVVDLDPVQVSASVLRRGFTGADVVSFDAADLDAAPVVGALAASWRFFGPLSLTVRWLRLPRFGGEGGVRIDDDVLVSLSANTVLTSR